MCNLSRVYEESNGIAPEQGGAGPAEVLGMPFRCDGRQVWTWGGNTNGELGLGFVTTTTALECLAPGNVKMACESVGGALLAERVAPLSGRNVSHLTMGYKHSLVRLGACPDTSSDRCGICFGDNRVCVGCSGITNRPSVLDWCGACNGDNSTCTGCKKQYACDAPGDADKCLDKCARPPPSRTDWTHLVPSPVLTGHVSSLLPYRPASLPPPPPHAPRRPHPPSPAPAAGTASASPARQSKTTHRATRRPLPPRPAPPLEPFSPRPAQTRPAPPRPAPPLEQP